MVTSTYTFVPFVHNCAFARQIIVARHEYLERKDGVRRAREVREDAFFPILEAGINLVVEKSLLFHFLRTLEVDEPFVIPELGRPRRVEYPVYPTDVEYRVYPDYPGRSGILGIPVRLGFIRLGFLEA